MKLRSNVIAGVKFALCGLLITAGVTVFPARADQWDKKTVLTINQPIQVMNTLLDPGTYVFKLVDSPADRHIVRILNADETHVITTILAIPNYRLQPTGDSRFAFWETPPEYARALRAWFYPGDNFGQEFLYPRQLTLLAVLNAPALAPPPAPEVPVAAAPEPAPAPQPLPSLQPAAQEPSDGQAQAEVAQNEPQAPPQAAPDTSQPQTALPTTASPFPMLGLAGLLSLILYGGLRRLRSS